MPRRKKQEKSAVEENTEKELIKEETKKEIEEEVKKEIKEKAADRDNYTLIICEKPTAAMKIAYALSDSSPSRKNFSGIPYYETRIENKKYIIASAAGHLFGLREKNKTNDWPVFDVEWHPTEGFGKKYIYALKNLCENASDFIIATDYDVEGEVIGFNILRFIGKTENARRMKFSALTKYDLTNSFKEMLQHVDFGQAYAGETRHYLDWFYGINLSRALMNAIKKAGSFRVLSIGRVQGPTLALIVERENKIKEFKPEPYWQIFLKISSEDKKTDVKYPENILDKNELEKFNKLKGKTGEAKTTSDEISLRPFPPFDLTTLQMEAYKFFGFAPAQTLAIAQRLYLRGLISYPRTSSQKLPPSLGYKRIIEKLKENYARLTDFIRRNMPIEGKKSDPAHPSIFPTGEFSGKLGAGEKQIYEMIVRRFISCFSDDALIEDKKINVRVDEYDFKTEGKRIIKKGWLEVYNHRIDEKILPDINGKVKIEDVISEEKETQPPKRYNAASLVYELEKKNLGTKSTRANIVDTLYKRGYITGKQIEATGMGTMVFDSLKNNCGIILDENLTRKFEEEMESIQKEKNKDDMIKKEEKIIEEGKQVLMKVAEQFKLKETSIGKILAKAENETRIREEESNKLFKCPNCDGTLIIIRSRRGKRFAACNRYPDCKTSFGLPQYGLIKVSDKKCNCGLNMLILIRKGMPPWNFCMNRECWEKKAEDKKAKKEEKKKKARKKSVRKKKINTEKIT